MSIKPALSGEHAAKAPAPAGRRFTGVCWNTRGVPDWGRFFCRARRFDAGILTDFQSNQRGLAGKSAPIRRFGGDQAESNHRRGQTGRAQFLQRISGARLTARRRGAVCSQPPALRRLCAGSVKTSGGSSPGTSFRYPPASPGVRSFRRLWPMRHPLQTRSPTVR